MGLFSQKKGAEKEQQAAQWLKKQKVQLLEINFRCKGGEIDLIGLDKQQTLIFFEVKFRSTQSHGHASEMITPAKQQKIIHCAQNFLQQNPSYHQHAMRFDSLTFEGKQAEPCWLKDAFWAGGF